MVDRLKPYEPGDLSRASGIVGIGEVDPEIAGRVYESLYFIGPEELVAMHEQVGNPLVELRHGVEDKITYH